MISLREYILENSVLNVERARQAGNLVKRKNSEVSKNNNSLPSRQNTTIAKQTNSNNSDTEGIWRDTKDSTTKYLFYILLYKSV